MSKPKISVVIPIYKTGKILRKTLASIQNQTFSDFECVLIDDGGHDQVTTQICKTISSKDNRFKLFEKNNEGIEKTRLFGVQNSEADLIAFCDHDDYYEQNAFEILYKNWEETNADIVVANFYSQMFHFLKWRKLDNELKKKVTVNKETLYADYYANFFGINIFPVSTWGKLYKKELFKKPLQCFGYNFFEDTVINAQLFIRASKVTFITDKIFTHVYGGLSSRFDVNTVIDAYDDIYKFRQNLLSEAGLFDKLNDFLLIEYKNVINQNIFLMIENNYSFDRFLDVIEKVKTKNIYKDMIASSKVSKQPFINLMISNNDEALYNLAKESFTPKMQMKKYLKKIIHSLK